MLKKIIDVYARFIFIKGISGFAFSAGLFLFYPSYLLPSYYLIFLVQEFYFSYYLTMQRNRLINGEVEGGIVSVTLFLSVLVAVGVFCFLEKSMSNIDLFFFYLSISLFPFYVSIAATIEKSNIEKWVRIESNSVFLASVSNFLILAILWSADHQVWGGIIFLRFFLFFCFALYLGVSIAKEMKIEMPPSLMKARFSLLKGVDVVLLLFALKYIYFSIYNDGFVDASGAGSTIKYFMVAYDFLAALAGLYIRRCIALNPSNKEAQRVGVIKVAGSISICAVFLGFVWYEQVALIYTLSFFAVSALLFSCLEFQLSLIGVVERLALVAAVVVMYLTDTYYYSAIYLAIFPIIYMKNIYA
jgi:hypothetical protein